MVAGARKDRPGGDGPLRVRVDPGNPGHRELGRIAEVIRGGGVVAYPTETYYGLGADPASTAAVERVMALKGRPADHPLLLVLDAVERMEGWVGPVPDRLEAVAAGLWPGAVTVVLPAAPDVRPPIRGPEDTVAVRVTASPVARALVAACGHPLTGTSANRSGEPPCREPDRVVGALGDGLDAILDAGPTPGGEPSTLLDLTCSPARILRAGAVPAGRIARLVPLA